MEDSIKQLNLIMLNRQIQGLKERILEFEDKNNKVRIIKHDLKKTLYVLKNYINHDAQIFHTTLQTLDDLYTLLDNKNFIFVNRSTIVNIAYAKILHKNLILMHDNSTFEISRHRQKIVYKAFIDYNS